MKTFMLSALIDGVLTLVFSFFAFFTLMISFKVYRPSAMLFSATAAAFFSICVYALSARRKRKLLSRDDSKEVNALMNTFNVCTYDENLTFFCSVFNKMDISASVTNEHISLSDGKKVVPAFYPSPLTDNQLKGISDKVKKRRTEQLTVLSSGFTTEAINYAKSAYISVFAAKDVYKMLKDASILPKSDVAAPSPFYKGFFKRLFVKNNGVRFILFGLTLFIMAFIVFYPLYYYIAGGVFIVFGLTSLVFAAPVKTAKTDLFRHLSNKSTDEQA